MNAISPQDYTAVTRPGGVGITAARDRGVLRLRGRDRQSFLQGMVSNDVARLQPGQSCRAAMLDSTGHILADLYIHATQDALLLECDPRCLKTLAEALEKYLIMEKVAIVDESDKWTIVTLLGDGAWAILTSICPNIAASELLVNGNGMGNSATFVVRSGRFNVPAFDIWLTPDQLDSVQAQIDSAGATLVNSETLEILRVEAGDPAWGSELSEAVLLPEAELSSAVSYTKGCYVGQEIVARIQARGHTNKALRSIVFTEAAISPHAGDSVYSLDEPEREIGRITSIIRSPKYAGTPLAMAYVRKEFLEPETKVLCRAADLESGQWVDLTGIIQ
jgi:folate-binding protein YgfZ